MVLTRLDANTNSEVVVTTDGAFGAVDVLKVFGQLPARYRSNASSVCSLDVLNEIRNLSNSQNLGAQVVNLQSDYSFELLGRPVYESSDIPDFTGTTGASNLIVVGGFSTGSVICDRLGSARLDVIPHLFGTTNNRPTGQSGFYFSWRSGHDLISPTGETGFRLLQNQAEVDGSGSSCRFSPDPTFSVLGDGTARPRSTGLDRGLVTFSSGPRSGPPASDEQAAEHFRRHLDDRVPRLADGAGDHVPHDVQMFTDN